MSDVELTDWQMRWRKTVVREELPAMWEWEGWQAEGWFAVGEVFAVTHWKLQDLDYKLMRLADRINHKRETARKAARR